MGLITTDRMIPVKPIIITQNHMKPILKTQYNKKAYKQVNQISLGLVISKIAVGSCHSSIIVGPTREIFNRINMIVDSSIIRSL
jgi:hypothetical protein